MRVLVTGDAGYTGSHRFFELLNAGHKVFVVDNLCKGHGAAIGWVRKIIICDLQFINTDIFDSDWLDKIFKTFELEAVIHFVGLKAVGESIADPLKYYDVNAGGTISLLEAMVQADCLFFY